MTDLDKLFEAIKNLTPKRRTSPSKEEAAPLNVCLIVGLGNPGREYRDTRHNIGFMVVDKIAKDLGVDFTRAQAKALVTDGSHQGHKIYLAKPQTYMNKSGHATRTLLQFYKLDFEDLLVIYDDVDLPFGTIRLKPSGGSGGHKGMQSIIKQLGTQDFPRLRLGVGRPPGYKQAANYVLKPFSRQEAEHLDVFIAGGADASLVFVSEGIDEAMTRFNRSEW
jgi:PTH1 family peptidyl-tRNA hydrolase